MVYCYYTVYTTFILLTLIRYTFLTHINIYRVESEEESDLTRLRSTLTNALKSARPTVTWSDLNLTFESLDPLATGEITKESLQKSTAKYGLRLSADDYQVLYTRFVNDKSNKVKFRELIKLVYSLMCVYYIYDIHPICLLYTLYTY